MLKPLTLAAKMSNSCSWWWWKALKNYRIAANIARVFPFSRSDKSRNTEADEGSAFDTENVVFKTGKLYSRNTVIANPVPAK
jgi:hypothetical protein